VNRVAFSPDGVHLAAGGAAREPELKLWDVATWAANKDLAGHKYPVLSLAFSPKGNLLATGSQEKLIRLWDVASGEGAEFGEEHGLTVTALAFSPDGKWLASGSYDRKVRVWNVAERTLKAKLDVRQQVKAVAFHPAGDWLAVAPAGGGAVQVWDWDGTP